MILEGWEAKDLFYTRKGTLFFDGLTLAFVGHRDLHVKYKFANDADEPGEKRVVVGDSFDIVKMLNDDEQYKIEVVGRFVIFRNVKDNKIELVIEGVTSF